MVCLGFKPEAVNIPNSLTTLILALKMTEIRTLQIAFLKREYEPLNADAVSPGSV